MEVTLIPALADNYIFAITDPETKSVALVDPGDTKPVFRYLEKTGTTLTAIFNTHHHWDHIGGNEALLGYFPEAQVYGGIEDRGRIPKQDIFLREGDRLSFARRTAEIFFVPGHTRAHIVYYFAPTATEPGHLFCGDTLFAGGCGRLFEGTPAQMLNSLNKLRHLPNATLIWCAHEYTLKNLQFALTVEPENQDLQIRYQQVQQARAHNQATIPSQIGLEKRTNPFLRWDVPALQQAMGSTDPVQTFARLRSQKDKF